MDVVYSPRLPRNVNRGRIALFPGAFHPVTRAHLALAEAAARQVEEVWFVLAKQLPHKQYEGVPLEGRLEILAAAVQALPWAGIALSEGGLFLEIAREARQALQPQAALLLCGRDAAERIVSWPYPAHQSISHQLEEYRLLVAARQGEYQPPRHLAHAIETLEAPTDWDALSSTLVRQHLALVQPDPLSTVPPEPPTWQSLVPPEAVAAIRRWYLRPPAVAPD